jgi:hypothetical protein
MYESDLVIVMQRTNGHAGQLGHMPHAQVLLHATDYAPSRHVRVNYVVDDRSPRRDRAEPGIMVAMNAPSPEWVTIASYENLPGGLQPAAAVGA